MRVWELEPGRLMVSGAFSDLAIHHHAAVQITLGAQGPLEITRDGNAYQMCRLVVVGSGARHAVRSDATAAALTMYFGLQTPQGVALNTLARNGVWIVDDGQQLAEATAAALADAGPQAAAEFLVERLCGP
ncbi:hypothetical protein ATCCBAA256_26840, partial [Mycobacterium montefiorense]